MQEVDLFVLLRVGEVYMSPTVHRFPVQRKREMVSRTMNQGVRLMFSGTDGGRIQLCKEIREKGSNMMPEGIYVVKMQQIKRRTKGNEREE